MRILILTLVTFACFVPDRCLAQTDEDKAALDELVRRVQEEFEVPGLCVSIVKDDRVLVSQGYGVRELGKEEKVDSETLFAIASNSKAFTAVALGILVDEKKLKWNDKVVDHLPDFRMSDRYVTDELMIVDLLVHRSGLGLGAGDLLFWPPTDLTRKQLVRRLRHVPLSTSFRSFYAYDNVLYPVAGEVIEAVGGKSWEEFVKSRILDRVGMKRSLVYSSELADAENVASPHAPIDDHVQKVEAFYLDNANPAGGIGSCADDMAKWHRVLLSGGKLPDGERLYSESTARLLWTLFTPIPFGDVPPAIAESQPQFNGYALGFGVRDYRGKKLVSHTGGLPGYLSMSTLVPQENLGVVVLTNQESAPAFMAITYSVIDHFLGEDKDWVSAFGELAEQRKKRMATADAETESVRDESSKPPLPLKEFAGMYVDPWYGDIEIRWEDESLRIDFTHTRVLIGSLEHWQHNTFVAKWDLRELRADAFVTFDLNPDGSIELVRMKAVSAATDFSFDFHDLKLKPKR